MRLKITKSKNKIHYSIIKDFTNLSGKRTTKVFENLGLPLSTKLMFINILNINLID